MFYILKAKKENKMFVCVCVGGVAREGVEILVVFCKRVVNFCIVEMYTSQNFQNNGSEIQIVTNTDIIIVLVQMCGPG
jgi:co-chaperonin GroES (HSP10)